MIDTSPDSKLQIPDKIMIDTSQWNCSRLDKPPFRPGWLLAGLVLFGIGFGFVEAVVAVELRAILSPTADRTGPRSTHDVIPLIAFDRLERADPIAARLMRIEVLREAATLIALAGVGVAAGRTCIQRFAAFLLVF